jgi:hypothetical protein
VVAVITDVQREGKPVTGFAFNSTIGSTLLTSDSAVNFGVRVAAVDTNADGLLDIIAGAEPRCLRGRRYRTRPLHGLSALR